MGLVELGYDLFGEEGEASHHLLEAEAGEVEEEGDVLAVKLGAVAFDLFSDGVRGADHYEVVLALEVEPVQVKVAVFDFSVHE